MNEHEVGWAATKARQEMDADSLKRRKVEVHLNMATMVILTLAAVCAVAGLMARAWQLGHADLGLGAGFSWKLLISRLMW